MSYPPLLNGPIPPYTNPPIQPQFYLPNYFFISDISFGNTTTITLTEDHNYVIGQIVRLLIPNGFGSVELNEKSGLVIDIPSTNQILLDLFSIGTSQFIDNPLYTTKAQTLAIGDNNSGSINAGNIPNQLFINGSFINTSPN